MKSDICIVVIGYNREKSLKRCLDRLNECVFEQEVDLYISIDNSVENKKTTSIAKNFIWQNGTKYMLLHQKRLGLKQHVLNCGDIVNQNGYKGIIMLEDDIYVANDFFNYVTQCLDKYDICENIAGISLYKHDWNINSKLPFQPIYEGADVFFLQYAQSWGQAWSKRMWNEFKNWYIENDTWDKNCNYLPYNVRNWPENSWLKYCIKYCAIKQKFFVYPFNSLSTNFSDVGEHNLIKGNSMQRMLSHANNKIYKFIDVEESQSVYDCFFENIYLKKYLDEKNITIDLYGKKFTHERYVLTTKKLRHKILKDFALDLKPMELNVLYNIQGTGIFLYDTSINIKNSGKANLINYFWYDFDIKDSLKLLMRKIINKIINSI